MRPTSRVSSRIFILRYCTVLRSAVPRDPLLSHGIRLLQAGTKPNFGDIISACAVKRQVRTLFMPSSLDEMPWPKGVRAPVSEIHRCSLRGEIIPLAYEVSTRL